MIIANAAIYLQRPIPLENAEPIALHSILRILGFPKKDLDTKFEAGQEVGIGTATLREIIAMLEQTYCRSVGVEYVYIRNTEIVRWLRGKMETSRNMPNYPVSDKKNISFKSLTEQ